MEKQQMNERKQLRLEFEYCFVVIVFSRADN
jgi:hypothetical protein